MFQRKLIAGSITLAASLSAFSAYGITLEEATYIAIENNPTVRQAIAQYRERLENMEVSKRNGFYPSLDLTAGIGHETSYNYQGTGEDVDLTRKEVALTLTQPIFNGFGSRNDVKRLQAEAEAERWNAFIQVESKALEVSEAYTDVLRNRELLELARTNLNTHNRIYQQIQTASNSGVGRQSDFSQVSARLAKAEANRLSALNNLRAAEAAYLNVVGELPPTELIYPEPDETMLPDSLSEAVEQALQNNPALDSAKWDVKATEFNIETAKSSYYPELNLVVERTFDENIDGREGSDEDFTAMLRMSYNLYSGGADKRAYRAAQQQNIQASEIQRNATREAELQARLAWAAYEASLGSKSHLRQYVTSTKESQMAYAQQFSLGRRTLLDVLDSENELFEARQDYVNADYDELYAEFRLFNSKGDLMRALRIYQPEDLGFNQNRIEESRQSTAAIEQKTLITDETTTTELTATESTETDPSQSQVGNSTAQDTPIQSTSTNLMSTQPQPIVPEPATDSRSSENISQDQTLAPTTNSRENTYINEDGVIFIDATEQSSAGGW